MDSLFLINQILFFLSLGIGVWLSLWVYLAAKEKKLNILFFWMVTLWMIGVMTPYFLFRTVPFPQNIITFLPKLEVAFVFLFFILFYFFTITFLNEEKRFKILNKTVIFVSLAGALIAVLTDLFQKEVLLTADGKGLDLILTLCGKVSWLGFVLIMTVFIFGVFIKNYFSAHLENKRKIQYFIVGLILWIIINLLFNVYFPFFKNTFKYAYFGNYSIIILFFFTALAIVKQNLFGIRVIITQIFVALIAILLAVDALVFTSQLTLQIIKGIILVIFLYFGYLLIKSVSQERKRREELEKLTSQLQVAHNKLSAAYEKLQRLDQAKSEFVSIASHQLRTPLTAIKGYISMILEGTYGGLTAKLKKPLENVYQSNERLIKLVNDLLSVSRIEAGRLEPKLAKTNVVEIIESVLKELKIQADNKKIKLMWEQPAEPLPEIMADKEQIRQIILNFIDNAIRYTNKGYVAVGIKRKPESLVIVISDTGEGMEKQEIALLFESFSRGQAGTRFWTEGTGLGLYVAKKFAEMNHGKVWAESPGKGQGSAFYIELPIA